MSKVNYKACLTVHELGRKTKVSDFAAWLRKVADDVEADSSKYSRVIARFRMVSNQKTKDIQ